MTVDAEDHTTTDSTLSIVRELRADFPWLGTVLQAYLQRTEADCEEFAAVRRADPAVQGRLRRAGVGGLSATRDEVTDSYLRCLRVLMAGSGYPMVASHDPAIIDAVPGAGRANRPRRRRFRVPDALRHPRRRAAPAGRRRATTCGCTCRSAPSGTATSCAGWPSGRPT